MHGSADRVAGSIRLWPSPLGTGAMNMYASLPNAHVTYN